MQENETEDASMDLAADSGLTPAMYGAGLLELGRIRGEFESDYDYLSRLYFAMRDKERHPLK